MAQEDDKKRDDRIEKMRMEQDEMILRADVMKFKRLAEEAEMELRVLEKKRIDLGFEIEDAEGKRKKAEEELHFKEEELKELRKKIQITGRG